MPERVAAGMERSIYARRWLVEAEMLSGFISGTITGFKNGDRIAVGIMAPLDQTLPDPYTTDTHKSCGWCSK